MTGNANFPSPSPSIAEISAAVNDFNNALLAAATKNKTDVAVKNEKRKQLAVLIAQLASSVMATAKGDRAMLVSSGYDMAGNGERTFLVKPENIQVKDGLNSGELLLAFPW